MAVLVTGGSGFVGSNLALRLQKDGSDVVILDDFLKGSYKNLAGFEGEVIAKSILDIDPADLKDIDAIYHQAAVTDTTVTDQKLMLDVNYTGFKKLLDYSVSRNIPFVYASSAAVYGNAPSPQKEASAGKPSNIYGFSKWMCDCAAMRYMKEHESTIVGLRYFNVYGPGESYKGKMASMIWQLAVQMREGKAPKIFKYGEQRRDQVYVKDVVTANLLAAKSKKSGIVNAASGEAVSFNRIIEVLNEVLGYSYKPTYIDNPYTEFYQEETKADLTQAKKLLKYEPEWKFEKAVNDYMKTVGAIKA